MDTVWEGYKDMPQLSDEILMMGLILGIAIFILILLLVGVFAIFISEQRRKEEISFSSLAKASLKRFTFPKSKKEAISPSLAPEVLNSSPEDGQKNTFRINQRAINLLRVPITVVLMMGLMLVLVLVNPTDKSYGDAALEPWLWSFLRIFVGIGGGGAIGVRIAHLSWRQTVLTALLAGAGAMLISKFKISPFEVPPFYFGPWDSLDGNFQFDNFLIGTLAVTAPVFLLPLFDPILRQSGLAPFRERMVFPALVIVISCMFILILPIAVGVLMGFTGFLLGIGVILSLYRPMETLGAELGALGLILLPVSSFVWLAYVSGSFS